MSLLDSKHGYTLVELMVTVVIVAVLAATLGIFLINLLTLQEQDREEAYIRERLVDICGIYADYLSVGLTVSNTVGSANFDVKYPEETSGISFETGRVIRVAMLRSSAKLYDADRNLCIDTFDVRGVPRNLSNEFRGDDIPLMTAVDLNINDRPVLLRCWIDSLNGPIESAAIGNLHVRADYWVKRDNGFLVPTNAIAERIVRLWNHE